MRLYLSMTVDQSSVEACRAAANLVGDNVQILDCYDITESWKDKILPGIVPREPDIIARALALPWEKFAELYQRMVLELDRRAPLA